MLKVFISYSHAQSEWVLGCLDPCLRAGGAEVLVDHREFVAGSVVIGQMDAIQDQADRHVLVLSREYLTSEYCIHEMERAIALDPTFCRQIIIPVLRDGSELPDIIDRHQPIYVDLRDDGMRDPWHRLLSACGASLGTTAPAWLKARDDISALLAQDKSVNLVVKGGVKWDQLLDHLVARPELRLANIDLLDPATVPRRGLIAAMLTALGSNISVPQPPEDLPQLGRVLGSLGRSRLVFRHFDMVLNRPDYGVDLFAALRFMVMDKRQLVVLAQSRTPFAALLPQANPISKIYVETVELQAHP
jgi:hypothetical protein